MDTTHLDPTVPAPRSSTDPLHELRSLGEFRILRRLGEGGMGSVYLGYQEEQGVQVAIKVLADHLASNQPYVERFYREAHSGVLLNHPNIVRCLTVGQDQATGKHYLVLEYVDGPSAQVLLERFGRLSVGDAVHLVLDIARGLEHVHSRNIIHRDIKPGNILTSSAGVAKLADLGLAKRTDEASHLTATRQGFGTPHYMPYEQAINAKYADGRSDIYALGATLYHLLTGEVPFPGENHLDVVEKKNRGLFTPASAVNAQVPRELDAILDRMLARDPRDRYQTASELIIHLQRSGLAAPVPSFVDPAVALQDPWVRVCLATANQPTRPDLEAPAAPKPSANGTAQVWHLRYRNREGRLVRTKATTRQIVRRLAEGRLNVALEASPQADGLFRPLRDYPEFRDVKPEGRRRKAKGRKQKAGSPPAVTEEAPAEVSAAPARRRWLVWVGAGAGLLLALGGLAYLLVLK